jgi:carbon monoxide dehydrogenase subunit G
MKFENAFTVDAPVDTVWATLLDVERVAPCMPGAEVLERTGDDAYAVGIRVRLGPISMQYRGQVEIVERDEAAHQATMRARAREARGQGTADANVHMSLVEQPDGTHATIATDLQLSGRAAAMGQGVIVDVAGKLVETFATNLAAMLASGGAPDGAAAAAADGAPGVEPQDGQAAATAPATGDAAASGEPGAGGAGARQAAPAADAPPFAPSQDSLPVGQIAASVIADRLGKPRSLLLATAALALVSGTIGYAIGKSR